MTTQLHIGHGSHGLKLPIDAVMKQHFIVGQSSSGKTNEAVVFVEELAKANQQFVVVDEPGVWWGLRSSADGKKDGLQVFLLGGEHGDMPLDPSSGTVIADFVVSSGHSFVLDLSLMKRSQWASFMVDFCTRLYEAKARNKSPLHLVLDEADLFIPETPNEKEFGKPLLEMIDNIARRGRARGLRGTFITQRPQVINKSIIAQSDVLHVFRLSHPLDRKALDLWVRGNATADQLKAFTDDIASLDTGHCFVWSPHWLKIFERVHVRRRETFDSSKTPEVGAAALRPKVMTKVDIEGLKSSLLATIDSAKLEDPTMLRAQIAELKEKLANQMSEPRRVPYVPKRVFEVVQEVLGALRVQAADLNRAFETMRLITHDDSEVRGATVPRAATTEVVSKPAKRLQPDPSSGQKRSRVQATAPFAGDGPKLRKGERRILAAAVRHHPVRLTRAQLSSLAKLTTKGGTFGAYISLLLRVGLIDEVDDLLGVTAAGLAHAGVKPSKPLTRAERVEMWMQALRAGERKMLAIVLERGEIARDDLAKEAELTANAGTFGAYLSVLRRNELVAVNGEVVTIGSAIAPASRRKAS